jgi:hypothetical protein
MLAGAILVPMLCVGTIDLNIQIQNLPALKNKNPQKSAYQCDKL